MKQFVIIFIFLFAVKSLSQTTTIEFETNGQTESIISENPFQKFFGHWKLKDDKWIQNWGGATEMITIPKHHTVSSPINTKNSLLSIIDGPQPNGHIFWSYNPITKEVHHLSSFGALRAGVGKGTISEKGAVSLKISFEGEPSDTYRIYAYRWIDTDTYHMKSVQFDTNDAPTGLFYEGTFVRMNK